MTITGASQNISAAINAVIPAISVKSALIWPSAYQDSEVGPLQNGIAYYNTTTGVPRGWFEGSWFDIVGNSGGGNVSNFGTPAQYQIGCWNSSTTIGGTTTDSTTTHALFAQSGACPQFRAIVAGDIPTLNQNTTGTAAGLSANIAEAQVTNLTTDLAGKQATLTGTGLARNTGAATELSGDATTSGSNAVTLATVNSNTGSCGDSTHVCQVTLDGKGRATAASAVAISGGSAFGGGVGASYQDVTEIAAPANPAAGNERLYTDSTAHTLKCLTSSGGNCLPGATVDWANPGAIGATTPNSGAFTSVNAQSYNKVLQADQYCTTPGVLDGTCLTNAIAALLGNGGVIQLPYGIINITTAQLPILVPGSVILKGRGQSGTTLNTTDQTKDIFSAQTGGGIVFEDFAITRTGATAVTGISESSTTVTVTSTLNPGIGKRVRISGSSVAGYNDMWLTTASNGSTFQFKATAGIGTCASSCGTALAVTSGAGIHIGNGQQNVIERMNISSQWNGVQADDSTCFVLKIKGSNFSGNFNDGIYNQCQAVALYDNIIFYNGSNGLEEAGYGGIGVSVGNSYYGNQGSGIAIHDTAGPQQFLTSDVVDTNGGDGIAIFGVAGINLNGVWSSSNGTSFIGSVPTYTFANGGAAYGIVIDNTDTNEIVINNPTVVNNGGTGLLCYGCTNLNLTGGYFDYNGQYDGTAPGIQVLDNGSNKWANLVIANNQSLSQRTGNGGYKQGYGLYISGGAGGTISGSGNILSGVTSAYLVSTTATQSWAGNNPSSLNDQVQITGAACSGACRSGQTCVRQDVASFQVCAGGTWTAITIP